MSVGAHKVLATVVVGARAEILVILLYLFTAQVALGGDVLCAGGSGDDALAEGLIFQI